MADADVADPEERALFSEDVARMRAALASLPSRYRRVIELTILGDCSSGDAAKILGVSGTRIAQIRSRALAQLRSKLVDNELLERPAS